MEIQDVRKEIQLFRQEMKEEFQTVRQEMKEEIQTVRQELKEEVQTLRRETKEEIGTVKFDLAIVKTEMRLLRWFVGGAFLGIVALVIKTFWPV